MEKRKILGCGRDFSVTDEKTLQTEIRRLETALNDLIAESRQAVSLREEYRKQREQHKASLALIKADYDSVLGMAENLLREIEGKAAEDEAEEKGAAKNDNADDGAEKVLIEIGNPR